jgi:hypothetical protein
MKKLVVVLLVLMALLLGTIGTALAITNGGPDGDGHPYVGLMVALDENDNPLWRCSGTLLSPTLFLTAGHCTEAPAARATIWFDADVESGIPDNGYPFAGDVFGTTYTHPDYNPGAFFLYDLGVVVLDEAVDMDEYGVLPELGVLDGIEGADKKAAITAVGYGLQEINPNRYSGERIRLVAALDLINTKGVFGVPKGTSIKVSGSGVGGDSSDTGGTCFGDSGGPQFLAESNVVVAVTSFGLNGNCAGVGGGYRVDQADDLDWLYGEFGDYLP